MEVPKPDPFKPVAPIPQPNFPTEDIHEQNIAFLSHTYTNNADVLERAEQLEDDQVLYTFAIDSLRQVYTIDRSEETYKGFRLGFAMLDVMAERLRGGPVAGDIFVRQFERLLPADPMPMTHLDTARMLLNQSGLKWAEPADDSVNPDEMRRRTENTVKRFGLAERHKVWHRVKPNTFRVVMNIVHAQEGCTARFAISSALGAQVAAELQDPTIAA